MKTLNLVVAIIYTAVYALLFLGGMMDNDGELVMGAVLLSVPVIVNWITFSKLEK